VECNIILPSVFRSLVIETEHGQVAIHEVKNLHAISKVDNLEPNGLGSMFKHFRKLLYENIFQMPEVCDPLKELQGSVLTKLGLSINLIVEMVKEILGLHDIPHESSIFIMLSGQNSMAQGIIRGIISLTLIEYNVTKFFIAEAKNQIFLEQLLSLPVSSMDNLHIFVDVHESAFECELCATALKELNIR
jgi:hypothetical protein